METQKCRPFPDPFEEHDDQLSLLMAAFASKSAHKLPRSMKISFRLFLKGFRLVRKEKRGACAISDCWSCYRVCSWAKKSRDIFRRLVILLLSSGHTDWYVYPLCDALKWDSMHTKEAIFEFFYLATLEQLVSNACELMHIFYLWVISSSISHKFSLHIFK